MWRSMIKVAAAVGVFGVLHSLLGSRAAKQTASSLLGERNRNGLYRVFYIGQSLASLAVLLRYIRSQPSREIYDVQGLPAVLMHAGQAVALGSATWAAHQVGIPRNPGPGEPASVAGRTGLCQPNRKLRGQPWTPREQPGWPARLPGAGTL